MVRPYGETANRIAWIVAAFACISGCSSTPPSAPAKGTDPTTSAGTGGPGSAISVSAKPISSNTAVVVAQPTDLSLASFTGCGVTSFDPSTSLGNQSITSDNFSYSGTSGNTAYTLTLNGALSLGGTLSQLSNSSQFNVVSATPPPAKNQASQDIAQKADGTITAQVVPAATWDTLFDNTGWQGLHCGIIPITQLKVTTQAQTTQVSFSPALPYNVSPVITADRFHLEFPSPRTFQVSATITQSSTNKVQTGQIQGTVTITPIAATGNITDNANNSKAVNADYAFRVENNFGNATNSLGLYTSASYYITGSKIVLAIINTGLENAPDVLFSGFN